MSGDARDFGVGSGGDGARGSGDGSNDGDDEAEVSDEGWVKYSCSSDMGFGGGCVRWWLCGVGGEYSWCW